MRRKRSSTVDPVWGTLINFLGLRKLNARGLAQANKIMLMAATVYNLKKLMKFKTLHSIAKVAAMHKKLWAFIKVTINDCIKRKISPPLFSFS